MQPIRHYLFYLIIASAIVAIMIGAYAAVAFSASNVPKATWLKNPLSLRFQASGGRGGGVDSVTCNRPTAGLTLLGHTSKPNLLMLTLSPTSFSCGSSPLIVSVSATCLVSAAQCRGTYAAIIQIRQPSNYRDIPANLQLDITVT